VRQLVNGVWNQVGANVTAGGTDNYLSITTNQNGTPYVTWQDTANGKKCTFSFFNQGSWQTPHLCSTGEADYITTTYSKSGAFYVAYSDVANGGKATVMTWNGALTPVGAVGFSGVAVQDISIALDPVDQTPVVAYLDATDRTTVQKYNATTKSWSIVGNAGFGGLSTQIAVAPDGTIYVNEWNAYYAKLWMYNTSTNGAWVTVGGQNYSSGAASNTSLAVAPNGTPLVAYEDVDQNGGTATVKAYSGGAWQTVGKRGFSPAYDNVGATSLAIMPDGTPWLLFTFWSVNYYEYELWAESYQLGIAGSPSTSATVGTAYSFTPTAVNANSFSVSNNLPPGLSFNTATGALTGTPTTGGTYSNIVISASNYTSTANLAAFTITVAGTAPGAPTIGAATGGNAQATVAFTAPASNGGSVITGYTATSTPGNFTGSNSGSPITVTGLTNGTSYTFTVKANNAAGAGPASAASAAVIPVTVPGAPTGVSAIAGNGQATVTFSAPASNGGSPITGYTVSGGGIDSNSGSLSLSHTITGLTNGTSYTFTVKATSSAGTGAASAASAAVTPKTVPNAPAIGTATAGNGQATVTFTAPASNGGSAITGYTATSTPGNITGSNSVSPITVTGLTNGTSYTFTVTATNAAGTGLASAASNSVSPQQTGQTISFAQPAAQSFGTTPTLTATASSGLTVSFTSATTGVCTITSPGGVVTFVAAGTCTINANQAGNAGYSAATQVSQSFPVNAIVPGAPTIGTASGGNALASVTFAAPAATGGSAITGYTVTSSPGGLTGTGSTSPITVYGLTNGTPYTFTVRATNSAGTGAASAASNGVAPTVVFTPVTNSHLYHTATQLSNGKILIAGGQNKNNNYLSSAELYDPATGVFTATGNMTTARIQHTATLLPNGKVLIAGGLDQNNNSLSSAELYDPATGVFTATSNMASARNNHTATLLQSGKVLIAGGQNDGGLTALAVAELFDPSTGAFIATSTAMTKHRTYHTATLLQSGMVLIAGGYNGGGYVASSYEASAELYDPGAKTFTATGSMTTARNNQTSTLLPSGKVLITGGWNQTSAFLAGAELYNPSNGTFSATGSSLSSAREAHSATLLPNGKVLIAGGWNGSTVLADMELYDPSSGTNGTFTSIGNMVSARKYHIAMMLTTGQVLISGGDNNGGTLSTAELYNPAIASFSAAAGSMTDTRTNPTATMLQNGKVLITGGQQLTSGGILNIAELYDPSTGLFTSTGNMTTYRVYHTATLLPNGKVLITGGEGLGASTSEQASTELYDPSTGVFTAAGNMTTTRAKHTATLLANGQVLLTGGQNGNTSHELSNAELYDPSTGVFTATTGNMKAARNHHSATLLPNGKVLIAGGWNNINTFLSSAELYDPTAGTFTLSNGNLIYPRECHTSTLLTNGKVLIAGGWNDIDFFASALLYDPGTDLFTSTNGNMTTPRVYHTATLLPNGQVLIAGGFNTSFLSSAEIYDPPTNTYFATAGMATARAYHTATLLTNGKVLMAGGQNSATLSSAELYNQGVGFSDSARPVITGATTAIDLSVSGSGFTGISEGSTGSSNSSATNYPLVQLRRVDNEQTGFVRTDPGANWSASSVSTSNTALAGWPNGNYLATVYANGIPSLSSVIMLAAPDAPNNGSATNENAQTTVSFDAPVFNGSSAITGYTVTCNPGNLTGSAGNSPITITGLTNSTTYTCTVTASNSFGTSPASGAFNSTPQKSSQSITFTPPGAQTFGTTPTLAAYAVATSALPVSFTSITPSICTVTTDGVLAFATAGTCTIDADQAGNAYFSPAPQVHQDITVNAVTPDAPITVTATGGNTQATVSFSPSGSNGGSAITGYTVTSIPAGGIDGNAGTTALSHIMTGLTNGATYTFTVTATNSVGTGSASGNSGPVTPQGVQTITFTPPAILNFGTTPLLTASADSGLLVSIASATPGVCTITNDVLTLVSPGTCTLYADQAGNAGFSPAPQMHRDITVNAVTPDAPTIGTAFGGNALAMITFSAPGNGGSAITGYTVTSNPSGGTDSNAGTTGLSHFVTGLTNGTTYTFSVTAANAVGTGSASGISNPVTPQGVQTITFTPPAILSFGTSPLLTASSDSGLVVSLASATPIVCSINNNFLTLQTTGTCTISADQAGNAIYSAASQVRRDITVNAVAPGVPTITAAVSGNAQATITFSAPGSNGGSTITGYTVTSSPGNFTASGSSSPITVTGLTNGDTYTFTVTATNSAGTGLPSDSSNPLKLQVAGQTINFVQPATQNFGTTPTLTATATSTLPVSFTSSTTGVCTITTSGALTFVTTGTCTINADQSGNASYSAAPTVSRSFTVKAVVPGAPTIGTAVAGNAQATVTFTAPASNGGSTITGYTVTSSPGNLTANGSSGPITVTGLTNGTAYTFTVKATNSVGTGLASGNSNPVTPLKAVQTINFAQPAAQNFGTKPTLTATATSGLTVSFSSSTTGVCTITTGGALTFVTAGTCTIKADQAGNASYSAAPSSSQTFTVNAVTPGAPTIGTAVAGNALATVNFTAPASNGGSTITGYTATSTTGSFTASGSKSPITVTGLTNGTAYTFTVTATNSAGSSPASGNSNPVTPQKAGQTITFAQPATQNFGTTPTLAATATSALTVSFTSSTTGVCTITTGGTLTFATTGTCTINADQPGNASYSAAPTLSRSFTVKAVVPGAPTIGTAVAGNAQATVPFTAPASSGGSTITGYTVTSTPGNLTAKGSSGPLTVTGLTNGTAYTFTVTATNAVGTGLASGKSNSVTPQKPGQTITFAKPAAQNFGTKPTLTATATSALPVSFTSSTTGVCTITTGGALTFVTAGTCTIKADQAGNASYSAAPTASQSFTVNAVAPGAPTIGTAIGGNGQAVISFTPPAYNGGSAITGYTVTSNPGNVSSTGATSPITMNGLANGTSYSFTVKAANSAGTSAPSAATTGITPNTVPVTTASPVSGSYKYSGAMPVTLSTTSGGTIYYSTNGTTPTTVYSGPVAIIGNVILKYRSTALGISETVNSAVYAVTKP
jgi:hypothetical protein